MGTLVNGIKEIFATSQSTATHLPVCASDGTPQGRISVGDLASVLGGVRSELTDSDLNNITTIGIYYTNGVDSVSNKPINTAYNNLIEVERQTRGNATRLIQRFYTFNEKRSWIRQKNEQGWNKWKEISFDIPSFYKNYADLSSLASALGATKNYGNVPEQTSANTLTTNGIYGNISGRMTNVPTGTWGLLVVFFGGNNYTLQLYLNVDGGASSSQYALWYRAIAGDSIFAWKKIATM